MLSLTTRLATVHEARDEGERAALAAFCAAVRDPARGRGSGGAAEPWPAARRFYTARPPSTGAAPGSDAPTFDAASCLRRWAPGLIPDAVREAYSLDLVPNLDDLAVAEISDVVAVREPLRDGRLAILALFRAAFEACLPVDGGADLLLLEVHPALVRPFAKLLGARRYAGSLGERSRALVPMIVVVSDCAHFERVGSLLTPLAWKTFVLGRRPPIELGELRQRFVDDVDPSRDVEDEWPLLEQRLFRRSTTRASLFHGLRLGIVDELHARGRTRTLAEGEALYAEADPVTELYVVLDGCFELLVGDRAVDVAGHGEVLGEVELLSATSPRTSAARALIQSRVLALTPAALRNLALGDPEAGYQVMLNLARFLAERFDEKSRLAERLDRELDRLRASD